MSQPTPPQPPTDGLPDPSLPLPTPGERAGRVLLRGAHVVDVAAGALRQHADVLIDKGRIAQVGERLAAHGARILDLPDRFLIPGLIDLHVHPGMMVGLRMDPNGMTPSRVERDLQVWLRYGVTTVQGMGSDRAFAFEIQREQDAGAFLGARFFSVGHGFGVAGGVPPFQMDPPGPVRLSDPAAIRATLEDLAARGASGVKLWYDDWYGQFPKMAPRVARAIIEEARRLGLTTYAHVYRVDDASFLIRSGLQVLAHVPRDRDVDHDFMELMLERRVATVPTLTVPESNVIWLDRPDWIDDPAFERFLPPGSREFLRSEAFLASIRARPEFPWLRSDLALARANTARLYHAGARVAFGTDAGVSNRVVGFAEHRELEVLVELGVRPADALRMATLESARVLGREGELGQIAPGCRADLVVLRANPLDDIRHTRSIESVWLDGVLASGALID